MDTQQPTAPVPSNRPGLSETGWAALCHLSSLCGLLTPLGNLIGPLVVWLVKRDDSAAVNDQGREAVNFQLSMTLYALATILACGLLVLAKLILVVFLAIPIALFISLLDLILTVVAASAASNGKLYRYPMTIRFIK